MKKRARHISSRFISDQAGQALILVLIFLLLGSILLVPALAHVSTALKTGVKYEQKTNALYAADAGVEDAIWQIKYTGLEAKFGSPYYNYIFSVNASYGLAKSVNGLATNVTISNVWIPSNITLDDLFLTPAQAQECIERSLTSPTANLTNRLQLSGSPLDAVNYRIKIDFYPAVGVTENLSVSSIGIWLPHGFTYNHGCNIATFADTTGKYTETEEVRPGGTAIVWNFSTPIFFTDLPPAGLVPANMPQTAEITFKYTNTTGNPNAKVNAIGWIVTSGPLSNYAYANGGGVPIAWDIDTRFYKVTSVSGDTKIEAYASRSELRNMYAATAGDYKAIGNSLMTAANEDGAYRETWHSSSAATLSGIPDDAYISQAWLYWSGFFSSGFSASFWGPEVCTSASLTNNWTNTNPDTVWKYYSSSNTSFRGHYTGSTPAARYLELTNSVDLRSRTAGKTIVEWEYWEDGDLEANDALKFEISKDNGATWSNSITAFYGDLNVQNQYYYYVIPEDYLTQFFKMRFYLDGFGSSKYCRIDNIAFATITGAADTAATFTVDGYDVHTESVNALESQLIGNMYKGQYSYACRADVTDLVKAHSNRNSKGDPNGIGNGTYTVGDVWAHSGHYGGGDYLLAYCGWSMVTIYKSSTTAGRQLYLWNTFSYARGGETLDFDHDGSPGATIKGFSVPDRIGNETEAAKLTCFVGEGDLCYSGDTIKFNGTLLNDGYGTNNVWNSKSLGFTANGVDIDTFSITWVSGLLHAGDSQAEIEMYTPQDNFNLIYIILSVRSETTVGGTEHYIITSS